MTRLSRAASTISTEIIWVSLTLAPSATAQAYVLNATVVPSGKFGLPDPVAGRSNATRSLDPECR